MHQEDKIIKARKKYFKKWREENKDKVDLINKRFYMKKMVEFENNKEEI